MNPFNSANAEGKPIRRIHMDIFGVWRGYEGRRRIISFGSCKAGQSCVKAMSWAGMSGKVVTDYEFTNGRKTAVNGMPVSQQMEAVNHRSGKIVLIDQMIRDGHLAGIDIYIPKIDVKPIPEVPVLIFDESHEVIFENNPELDLQAGIR